MDQETHPLIAEHPKRENARLSCWRVNLVAPLAVWTIFILLIVSCVCTNLKDLSSESGGGSLRSRKGIRWFRCPDLKETLCAYFEVPFDYEHPEETDKVSLAIRKLPAKVAARNRKGYLFMNPGGPAASGTEAVAREGSDISAIVNGEYDIMSFDPRGVNLTLPAVSCFPNEALARLFFRDWESLGLLYQNQPSASLDSRSKAISKAEINWAKRLDAYAEALDKTCLTNGNLRMLSHASTANTARDMKSILEALGESSLNYWGFSYGTVLGTTFAALFPDFVGRMVLDGVSDPELYHNNFWDWGRAAMNHTNRTYEGFTSHCASAGPERCALARLNDTASDISYRIDQLRHTLHDTLLPVISSTSQVGAGIITTSAIQHTIFRSLYKPSSWPKLAEALNDALLGNGSSLYDMLSGWSKRLGAEDPSKNAFHRANFDFTGTGLLTHVIHCSDTNQTALADHSPETLIKYMREMDNLSISGQAWALWIAQCRKWSSSDRSAYRGPWTRAEGLPKPKNPILFVGNVADPVTPLSATVKTAEAFGRDAASLLIQNGYGHCSYAQPSNCTSNVIRQYLLDGVIPEWGTTCEVDPVEIFP